MRAYVRSFRRGRLRAFVTERVARVNPGKYQNVSFELGLTREKYRAKVYQKRRNILLKYTATVGCRFSRHRFSRHRFSGKFEKIVRTQSVSLALQKLYLRSGKFRCDGKFCCDHYFLLNRYYHCITKIYRLPGHYFFKLCVIIDSFAPSVD